MAWRKIYGYLTCYTDNGFLLFSRSYYSKYQRNLIMNQIAENLVKGYIDVHEYTTDDIKSKAIQVKQLKKYLILNTATGIFYESLYKAAKSADITHNYLWRNLFFNKRNYTPFILTYNHE